MDLHPYVENLLQQLAVAAEAGGEESRALAERLLAPLDAALRLTLQDVLSEAAEEITTELAPGSVEVRLRGRTPEFVVTPAPAEAPPGDAREATLSPPPPVASDDDAAVSRINLRMPDRLKARVEQAAAGEGLSVNTWLVRAAAAALERPGVNSPPQPRDPRSDQRFRGWAR